MDAVTVITLAATAIGLVAGCVQVLDYWEKKRRFQSPPGPLLGVPGASHPPPSAASASSAVLASAAPPLSPVSNLPAPTSSFVGREAEQARLRSLLTTDDGPRLLTVTGMGGVGKTRLALHAAHTLLPAFSDGAWLCDLSALSDASQIAPLVCSVVGAKPEGAQTPSDALCRALSHRTLLLIWDNCEHLLDGASELAEAVLHAAAGVRILATSREGMNVNGEQVFPLSVLSVPEEADTLARIGQAESVRLFVQRAQASGGVFVLSDGNADAVARICRHLDGLPLAIELAGAHIRTLSPEQIAARLQDRFHLLTGGARNAPPRQHTLRATLDWSYDLLTEAERALFGQVSVFAGGWTLDAAQAVCGTNDADILDALSGLVDKSLVTTGRAGENGPRFRLLETLRAYSSERSGGDRESLRARHRAFFFALAEQAAPHLRGPQQARWLAILDTENDNLRAALLASDAAGRLTLAVLLHKFWLARGFVTEGRDTLDGTLAACEGENIAPSVRAAALSAAGVLAWAGADLDAAASYHASALALYRALGDRAGEANALKQRGIVADYRDDYPAARAFYDASLSLFRHLEDTANIASVLVNLGAHCLDRGQPDEAVPFLEESLRLRRALGDTIGQAIALHDLGQVALAKGDAAGAERLFAQSLALRRDAGDRRGVAQSLLHLALAAQAQKQDERAARLLGASDTAHGPAPRHAFILRHQEELTGRLVNVLGRTEFVALHEEGRAFSTDDAVTFALQDVSSL